MPGVTPFGIRVSAGKVPPFIDPITLGPAIYLSGKPNDGLVVSGGNLVHWFDKIANYVFSPVSGSAAISAFNDGSFGGLPGNWTVSFCGGNFFRGMDAAGTLPNFGNSGGYTQYILTGGIAGGTYGVGMASWRTGGATTNMVYQSPTFNGGGGNFWVNGTAVAGDLVIVAGQGPGNSVGLDTGLPTPTVQTSYDLWTLVSDATTSSSLYRNGGLVISGLNTQTVILGGNLAFGGPSAGSSFSCVFMQLYLLYTAQHTPRQIAGVHNWVKSNYGSV